MIKSPEIGPGNGYALFEEIDSLEFCPEDLEDPEHYENSWISTYENSWIRNCNFDFLQNTADALCMSSPFLLQPVRNHFSFLSSSSLSGSSDPTFDPLSRIARAKELSRFAALYADTVLIRDPFRGFLHKEDSRKLRPDFAITLTVIESLRAEIEAGVVLFAPTHFPLSEDGLREFQRVEDAIKERVFTANQQIIDYVLEQLEVKIPSKRNDISLQIRGSERYVPHGGLYVTPLGGRADFKMGKKLSEAEVKNSVQRWILDPSLIDLQFWHIINWLYDVRYLTDRQVDVDLLRVLGEDVGLYLSQLGARASHSLPFIDGLDAKTLIKLRQEEGEAFQVYRDRVRALVEQPALTGCEFDEAFRDLVQPELNKIDKAIASVRKMVKREMREKLIFGTGMVTIGLTAGIVTPEIGAIVAALGGAKFGAELLSNINTLISEPAEARDNDFFFLWKAREYSKRKNAEQRHARRSQKPSGFWAR